jgi:hypothetical protein
VEATRSLGADKVPNVSRRNIVLSASNDRNEGDERGVRENRRVWSSRLTDFE